ncbi:MAG: FAD-binding oxidoreductase [Porticoccaceae bacterium]|nr:FAD-binding oxidoreductase [Porticoccaceae bacterium]
MNKPEDNQSFTSLSELDEVNVFTDPVDLLTYRRDASAFKPGKPEAVVRPRSVDAVVEVLKRANKDRIPVYARGGASMYAGGVNPQAGGIALDMAGLDQILDIDTERGIVLCQPGVRFGALLEALRPHGQTVGLVPSTAPTATVGGAVSSHALGTGSPQFQSMGDQVAGLEVVLTNGDRVQTGSAAAPEAGHFQRYCIGPDLTGLFIGADGTLGIIVAVALWLHPLPATQHTDCYGFPDAQSVEKCILEIQNRELVSNIWYAGAYEAPTIKARVSMAFPDKPTDNLPNYALAIDFRGEAHHIDEDNAKIAAIAEKYSGGHFPDFNEAYFNKLRTDEIYWYSYAGFFAMSRCDILMSSLPTNKLSTFMDVIAKQREKYPEYPLGAAIVMCRRGLHGGVLSFYDEATQWDDVNLAMRDCAKELIKAGCVPYKSGKVSAEHVQSFSAYSGLLSRLKSELDPNGILSPGDLGLTHKDHPLG